MPTVSRRQFFAAGAAAAAVSTVRAAGDKPALRVGHITDVHITDAKDSPKGVAKMFEHLNAYKPDLILNSGDAVMAVNGSVTAARAETQIQLWKEAVKLAKAPIRSCLGNHDVWDGAAPSAAIPVEKKGFKLMTETLGMPKDYYSFDQGGWHFLALNSVVNWPDYGVLTPEHFQWLKDDLAKTPKSTPVCVISHLPIVSVTSSLYGNKQKRPDGVTIPKVWQHIDCWEISEVFRHHPNVKLCLSGHMHTCDRCEYRGVWYICGGAVSGAWWGGSEYGFPPQYGQLDLFESGQFEYRFTDYQWPARAWSGQQLKM